jgi:heme-degrading monooxygenase HmoA
MYAVVRKLKYDETHLDEGGRQQLAEFNAIHERQPGFRGSLVLRADGGEAVALNLWESERDAMAGLEVLRPAVQQLLEPLLQEPALLVGAGQVTDNTLRLG